MSVSASPHPQPGSDDGRDLPPETVDRLSAEAALYANKERFRQVAENLEQMFWLVDLHEMRALYVSPAFDDIWGRSRDPLYANLEPFWGTVHPEDVEADANARRDLLVADEREFRIRRPDGSIRWVRSRSFPVRDDAGTSSTVAGICEDVTEVREAREKALSATVYDSLTGLPNRNSFLNRLQRSLDRLAHRSDAGFAILFVGVDGFRVVNDSLGHDQGNRLLESVGRRLSDCVRPEDMVARHGGDEFALLLHNSALPTDAARVAQRIIGKLNHSFRLGPEEVFITASIGIVTGAGYRKPEDMVRDADIAMTRAKRASPGTFRVFDPAMHAAAVSRLRLETDLRLAVDKGEFHLFFQPILSLRGGAVAGFEALLRWSHPKRGMIAAAEFVPAAERMGLIKPIGRWALTEACGQMQRWGEEYPALSGSWVSVNLSPGEITQPHLVDHVREALERSGLDPQRLALEITEGALLEDSDAVVARLSELKDLGVRLQLDDFGTGYSALSYLSTLPVDAIKIDREFTRRIGHARGTEVVQAIRDLGDVLDMDVIAEGVETSEQRDLLRSIGCEYAQGFLFGWPFTTAEAERFIEERAGRGAS